MTTTTEYLDRILQIDGAIGGAVVNYDSGIPLGTKGGDSFDMELLSASNTRFVLANLKTLNHIGIDDSVEDLLVTLDGQYHLTRFLEAHETIFTYLILDRKEANLALARHQLARLATDLQLEDDTENTMP